MGELFVRQRINLFDEIYHLDGFLPVFSIDLFKEGEGGVHISSPKPLCKSLYLHPYHKKQMLSPQISPQTSGLSNILRYKKTKEPLLIKT